MVTENYNEAIGNLVDATNKLDQLVRFTVDIEDEVSDKIASHIEKAIKDIENALKLVKVEE